MQVDKQRSYIIALAPRGVHALENVGVHLPVTDNRYLGTVTHPFKGKDRVSPTTGEASVSFERCSPPSALHSCLLCAQVSYMVVLCTASDASDCSESNSVSVRIMLDYVLDNTTENTVHAHTQSASSLSLNCCM